MGSSTAEGFEGRPAPARPLWRAWLRGQPAGEKRFFACVAGIFLEGKRHEASVAVWQWKRGAWRGELGGRARVGAPELARCSAMSWPLRPSHGPDLDIPVCNLRVQQEPRARAGSANNPRLHGTAAHLLSLSPFFGHNNNFAPSSCAAGTRWFSCSVARWVLALSRGVAAEADAWEPCGVCCRGKPVFRVDPILPFQKYFRD